MDTLSTDPWIPPTVTDADAESVSYYDMEDDSQSVTYVFDRSGSMQEDGKITAATAELWRSLEQLPATTRCNVVWFSDGVARQFNQPRLAGWRNLGLLHERLSHLPADGMTDLATAVTTGLGQIEVETVFLMSDGVPTVGTMEPFAIRNAAASRARQHVTPPRLFTVAFRIPEAAALPSALAADLVVATVS